MKKIIILILISFLTAACEKQYTRTECITKTILYWDESLMEKERIDIGTKFLKAKVAIWTNKEKLKMFIPGVHFENTKNYKPKFMYSQYKYECENKEKMLFSFLEHIRFYVPNFPEYQITNEVVTPSAKTISLSGPWWIDKAKFGE